jgi:putative acyl-CoA dehydrogenase
MRNVLADLALESEAATALSLRLARAFDRRDDAHEAPWRACSRPVAKFWICKRGSHFAQEAMECLGGNGYVEEGGEGVMARIYREMPLNSIWEGAGNIMALDLLRALRKADAAAALAHELAPAKGAHPALDRLVAALPTRVEAMATEGEARRLAQDVALAVQAGLLCQGRRRSCSPPSAIRAWAATGATPSARWAPAPTDATGCAARCRAEPKRTR